MQPHITHPTWFDTDLVELRTWADVWSSSIMVIFMGVFGWTTTPLDDFTANGVMLSLAKEASWVNIGLSF